MGQKDQGIALSEFEAFFAQDLNSILCRVNAPKPLAPYHINNVIRFHSPLPRLYLKNGASISVQAGRYNYCRPRNDFGPYSAVEVGYPDTPVPERWAEYADGPAGGVYAYLPVTEVLFFIGSHGGIDVEKTTEAASKPL